MGDSGAEDTSDSLTDADLDQIAADAEAIEQAREENPSNIVGSSTYDPQFAADQLAGRGLDPQGFMAPENFAQTTQGGFTGGTGPQETTINVPSVQAADTTPTFSGVGVSDVFDPMTMQAPAETMVEALGATLTTPQTRDLTPEQKTFAGLSDVLTRGLRDRAPEQTKQQRGLQAVAQTLGQAREKKSLDPSGIDFGVTDAPVGSTVGDDFGPALDMVDRPNMANITETALGARTPSPRTTDQILADQRRMQQGQIPSRAEDPFDPNVGAPFDVRKLEQMEAIMAQPNVLPGMLGFVEDKTKDALATSIALGRNVTPIEAAFGFTAPDMTKDKETIEEFNARTGRSIPQDQIVTDTQGVVIGLKDAMGNLVTGRDPSAQDTDTGGESEPKKKVPPKKPTDPCPEGYQLIDGKCTPTGAVTTDTGFVVFPPGRNPAFQRGPFTPATVATNPGIRGLNPITFNIPQNIFRR